MSAPTLSSCSRVQPTAGDALGRLSAWRRLQWSGGVSQWFSNFLEHQDHLEGLWKEIWGPSPRVSDLVAPRWSLKMCVCNKFRGSRCCGFGVHSLAGFAQCSGQGGEAYWDIWVAEAHAGDPNSVLLRGRTSTSLGCHQSIGKKQGSGFSLRYLKHPERHLTSDPGKLMFGFPLLCPP